VSGGACRASSRAREGVFTGVAGDLGRTIRTLAAGWTDCARTAILIVASVARDRGSDALLGHQQGHSQINGHEAHAGAARQTPLVGGFLGAAGPEGVAARCLRV
jgi:hypothetical protein